MAAGDRLRSPARALHLSSWAWETQQWLESWQTLLQVADELLAGQQLHRRSPRRPCSAEVRSATRARHVLPGEAVLFGYGFDPNSTAIRKNLMAALEAFQLAFPLPQLPATYGRERNVHPLSEHVALLIKTFPPQGCSAEWHWLQARAAEDSRIVLIAESLPRHDLLALYGCCDVFLSLHRSEGFGGGMAEALQLGVDVIATDFGGITDFCTGPLAHPVRYRSAPIPRDDYPYADGHSWAEPDLEHAAELCRAVVARRLALAANPRAADPSRDPAVLVSYRERFSFATVGGRYRARLEELWADREGVGARLRWRGDR